MKTVTRKLAQLLNRFGKDRSGNVLMIFALASIPVMGLVGAAIDYARATNAKVMLNAAIDSAALMASRDVLKLTDAELRTRIDDWIRGNLSGEAAESFTGANVTIDRTARTINISANLNVAATLTRVIDQDTMRVSSSNQASWGTNTIELALVLDNTGSMDSSNKMSELKKASLNLLTILERAAYEPEQIKVSIVPFNTQVKLTASQYKDEPWMRFNMEREVDCDRNGRNCTKETMTKAKWQQNGQGCVTDRDQDFDAADSEIIDTDSKRYPAFWCAQTSLQPIMPLTTNWDDLRGRINAMRPVGNTNVTIGAVWGLATLSPGVPFIEAKPATTPRLRKYMILLTDGDNTENRFTRNGDSIDTRTALACANIKAQGVQLYTIRVINGNASLLRNCASEPSMYKDVKSAADLNQVFQDIANQISAVRLSM